MSTLQLRIIKRAIKSRMADGEDFYDIIADYPKLTEDELAVLKSELGIVEENADEEGTIQ